jgi:hypothetical protein
MTSMYRSRKSLTTRQQARARRELAHAIDRAATPSLRDELIIIAQRGNLL